MSFESAFFKGKQVNIEKLLDFGFVQAGQTYSYTEKLLADDFQAQIEVSSDGLVTGRVIDLDLQEEYVAFRIDHQLGNFTGQVREAYGAILEKIASACFEEAPFNWAQANRLATYVSQAYGDLPDYPFKRIPEAGVYRFPSNQKWYALVMTIKRQQLEGSKERFNAQELLDDVEIVNLKVDPKDLPDLLTLPGVFLSYHMNKKSWLTVLLDGSLADDLLFKLVDKSRAAIAPKSYYAEDGPDYWVIPANLKYYDIDQEFRENTIVDWTQKAQIKAGDFVFIYITAPTRALRYACKVLKSDMPNQGQRDQDSIRQLMRLELLQTYPDDRYTIDVLKEKGVKAVRGPRRLTKAMVDVLKEDLKDVERD